MMTRVRLPAAVICVCLLAGITSTAVSLAREKSRRPAAAFRLKPEATPTADGWLPPSGGRTSEADEPRANQIRPEPNRGGALDVASTDVKVALERLKPAEGYEISLFASEKEFPDIANPLAMTFDTRGRLWVLTSPTYPHVLPGVPAHDKLVILDDVNQDGRADTLTVFADDLYIPTGFELGDGGAYVSQQPNLIFLRDTNRDGKADERRIVLHGFGTEDSHHSIHAFTWGPGGDLYFQEGTFLHSQVETPYGTVRLEEAGVFRYEPRTEKLSVFVSYGFANPWGHVVDRWGQNFISDASNGNNYYGTPFSGHVDYPRKQRPMQVWTLTQVRPTANIEFVSSRHFPDEAQGNFLVTNTIGFQGIKQYKVREEGSGFVAVETDPLLMSVDPNFRPIAIKFGFDGALYIADWFNPLVGHMQYSLRDPRRDTTHGRIWRITAKGRPLNPRPKIEGEPIEAQLELLKAYEDRTRYQARLALRALPTVTVVAALKKWIEGLDPAEPDYEHHLLEALWVYEHHDTVAPEVLNALLQAREFRARAAATRVLQHWFDRVDGGLMILKRMVNDPEPRVRLEAVRALSFVPTLGAAEIALEALKHPLDYYLQYVLDSTITSLEKTWKPALTSRQPFAAENPDGLVFLIARLDAKELLALPKNEIVLRAIVDRPAIDAASRRGAIEALAQLNTLPPAQELIDALERLDGEPGTRPVVQDLSQLLTTLEPAALAGVRNDLARLATLGKDETTRRGAFAGLLRADAGSNKAWNLASASERNRMDLLHGAAALKDARVLDELYPKILASLEKGQRTAPAMHGRVVRIVAPGVERSLRLAEVQVVTALENAALRGKATQSSIVAGGATGGQPERAIDTRTDSDPKAGSTAFTTLERNPWWEVDLGESQPIESITIWNQPTNDRTATLHVSVLDSSRKPVFALDQLPASSATERVTIGGDVDDAVINAAIAALAAVNGRDIERFGLLAKQIPNAGSRRAAIAALRAMPRERWPAEQLMPLSESLLSYIRTVPASERTAPAFKEAVELGREVAGRLPAESAGITTAAIDKLIVRTIRIESPIAEMKFSLPGFTVEAGEEIEIEFFNPDQMPHNLVITVPGALESVSLKAEAMAREPDGFARNFVPTTAEVLHSTKLLNTGETGRLRFTVPTRTGSYPYVCTFPGHWRTMNGLMSVIRTGTTLPGR
jgi:glucose/arabinose dehydrogenase/azurin